MRAAAIGLAFQGDLRKLVQVAVEAGRITHHNPVGYLGSVVAALFCGLAVRGVQPELWAAYLFSEGFPLA
jgi:ADP-ribosylglycohydrolase